jgi:hypothetical protein
VKFVGHEENVGGVLSLTVTVKMQDEVRPELSLMELQEMRAKNEDVNDRNDDEMMMK